MPQTPAKHTEEVSNPKNKNNIFIVGAIVLISVALAFFLNFNGKKLDKEIEKKVAIIEQEAQIKEVPVSKEDSQACFAIGKNTYCKKIQQNKDSTTPTKVVEITHKNNVYGFVKTPINAEKERVDMMRFPLLDTDKEKTAQAEGVKPDTTLSFTIERKEGENNIANIENITHKEKELTNKDKEVINIVNEVLPYIVIEDKHTNENKDIYTISPPSGGDGVLVYDGSEGEGEEDEKNGGKVVNNVTATPTVEPTAVEEKWNEYVFEIACTTKKIKVYYPNNWKVKISRLKESDKATKENNFGPPELEEYIGEVNESFCDSLHGESFSLYKDNVTINLISYTNLGIGGTPGTCVFPDSKEKNVAMAMNFDRYLDLNNKKVPYQQRLAFSDKPEYRPRIAVCESRIEGVFGYSPFTSPTVECQNECSQETIDEVVEILNKIEPLDE